MLTAAQRYALSRMNSTSLAQDLGKRLHHTFGCAVGIYDYSVQGGAVGDYNLKDVNGNDLKLPSGTLIMNVLAFANTAVTSGGSATIDLNAESANDLLAAEAKTSFSLSGTVQGIPDFATKGDYVLLTAERTLSLSVNTAALTAGKVTVFVFFVYT
jgi:hypothetical protein